MKILSRYEMSQWAYVQCFNGNDTPEMRALITNGYWAYCYCYFIKDREEVRKHITKANDLNLLRHIRELNETTK